MLTIEDIRNKVNTFPDNKPVEELINEIVLLYKIEAGLQAAKDGNVLSLEGAKKEMELWWRSR